MNYLGGKGVVRGGEGGGKTVSYEGGGGEAVPRVGVHADVRQVCLRACVSVCASEGVGGRGGACMCLFLVVCESVGSWVVVGALLDCVQRSACLF